MLINAAALANFGTKNRKETEGQANEARLLHKRAHAILYV